VPEAGEVSTVIPHLPDDEVRALLQSARTIAMVGASSNPSRPSHGVMRRLQAAGYRVIPVNPNEVQVHGERAVASLDDVREAVDIVDVFRRAEHTPAIADQAARIGAKLLWLQLGVVNDDAAARAHAAGLATIMDACIAVEVARLRVRVGER
jgi:predicted CoA-binding protein